MKEKDIKDDFWEIERLVPKRTNNYYTGKPITDTEPAEISFGENVNTPDSEKIPPREHTERIRGSRKAAKEPETLECLYEYKPRNPHFVSVEIFKWPSHYSFYDKFISDGKKYIGTSVPKCEYVPFFSYMPQYNQLTLSQLKYYIWWRENVRNCIYLQADCGYIFLYVYELINIEGSFTAKQRLNFMSDVWLAYRRSFPRLDRYISEWLCDFCLINRLSPPKEVVKKAGRISNSILLREFFSDPEDCGTKEDLYGFVMFNTEYKYKNSALYTEKTAEIFDRHLIAAAVYALENTPELRENDSTPKLMETERDSYSGALCACSAKRKIRVTFYTTFKDSQLKAVVTSLVKYSENRLREYLHIKNKLSPGELPQQLKSFVDLYYKINLPARPVAPDPYDAERAAEKIRYDLYEAKEEELNVQSALDIEDRSWDTTLKLIPEEELEQASSEPDISVSDTSDGDGYSALLSVLSPFQYEFLKLLHLGKSSEALKLCKAHNIIPASAEEEINALAFDHTGDIIIQDMQVIGDYQNELKFE